MTPPHRRLSKAEFIALMGVMFATIAFSIDAMLPALPEIARDLGLENANHAQLVLTSFVFGMGAGTLVAGPLSDAFGRRRMIFIGAGLYVTGAVLAYFASSLELLLAARVLQGLGAAGPRVVSMAMVRDLYAGRQMAQIISFAMLVFMVFPAVAPMIGAGIIALAGWRAIFIVFLLFSALSVGWLGLRQPETLPEAARRPLRFTPLRNALIEVLHHRQVMMSMAIQVLIFGILFGTISSIQQIFDLTFGRGDSFQFWFAGIALMSAWPPLINAALVMKLGMRPLIRNALGVQIAATLAGLGLLASGAVAGDVAFWVYYLWTASIFAATGFTIGNLNALALEPMGHIAGMAASVMSALATLGGALLGAGIGQLFNGTPLPLMGCVLVGASIAFSVAWRLPREAR